MKNLINFFKGMIIGIANIIPGLSGGTMAVVFDLYDDLINAISTLTKKFKENMLFLIPIGLGAGVGVLGFSKLLEFLLENYNIPTNFFFMGLILGSAPLIYKKSTTKGINPKVIISFVIALLIIIAMKVVIPPSSGLELTRLTVTSFIILFLSGVVAAGSMIIPGISGSFVLLLLGVYYSILGAVADLNIPILIPVALGVLVGVLATSKLIDILLKKVPEITYSAILGFVLGSLVVIYPGFTFSIQGVIAVVVLIIGAAASFISSK